MNPFELHGISYLSFYTMALIFGATVALLIRYLILSVDCNPWEPSDAIARELDPYEAAFLMGGSERVFVSACATLARHNVVAIDRYARTITLSDTAFVPPLHEVEQVIVSRLKRPGGTSSLETMKLELAGCIQTVRMRLVYKGLATTDETRSQARFWSWLCFIAISLMFSMPKIAMAAADKHPHGLLFMLAVIACAASLGFLKGADKTNKGRMVMLALSSSHSALQLTHRTNPSGLSLRDTALAYGLFGSVALVGDPFADVLYGTRMQRANGGSCGSGHSCGGGSCGGGGCGGGCGGCGG